MMFDMERGRALKLLMVCGAAMSLQGCIAAVFPLAASGLIAGNGRTKDAAPSEMVAEIEASPTAVIEDTALSSEAARNAAATDEATATASATSNTEPFEAAFPSTPAQTIATTNRPASAPAEIAQSTPAASQLANATTVSAPTARPAPAQTIQPENIRPRPSTSMVVPIPEAPPAVAGGTFFDPLVSYATAPKFAGSGTRTSAILRDPTMLEPDRNECTQGVSTVLIDLDPEDGELLPIDPRSASPAFADRLAQLRVRGIIIAWISESSIENASDIRVGLSRSGLDPLGIDEVLLMRTSDERKQSRRDELARNSCLIAIAGDTRSDFHELFGYLLNPGDGASLQPLIGEGWFLIPTPLLSERPAQ